MIAAEDRKSWTEEALSAMSAMPEAHPSTMTTETAAWRAGFVAGWIARRAKEKAGDPAVVPGGR